MDKPDILYKYKCVDEYLFDLLINNEFYFSSGSEFNDPFDSKRNFDFRGTKAEWKEWILKTDLSYIENKEVTLERLEKLHKIELKFEDIFPNNAYYLIWADNSGAIINSLSATNDNVILWSHYSEQHKGVCLGFNVEWLDEMPCLRFDEQVVPNTEYYKYDNKLVPYFKVNYSVDMPNAVNPVKNNNDADLFRFSYTKHKNWEYEQEYRGILMYPWFNKKKYKFNKNTLNSITFGINCPDEHKRTIKKLVEELYIEKGYVVKLYQAVSVYGKYSVNIYDYSLIEKN